MDLSTWSLHHYHVPGWKSLLVNLGANAYRCEYCRHNFISLRRRKYRFTFRRNEQRESTSEVTAPVDG